MNVVHIQTGLPVCGNVPYKLHNAFRRHGIQSCFIVFESKVTDLFVEEIPRNRRRLQAIIYHKYHKYLKGKLKVGSYLFSNPITIGSDLSKNNKINQADVIYIHWAIGGFLSFSSVEKLLKIGKPVICYLHDMWAITGGCHHSFECHKYEIGCFDCPLFRKSKTISVASIQMEIKQNLSRKYRNLFFLAPSNWLFECAINSIATRNENIFMIPHLYDHNVFFKKNKNECLEKFSIPNKEIIIGFGALNPTTNPFKGWNYLSEALNKLSEVLVRDKVLLVIFGNSNNLISEHLPFQAIFLDRIIDENKLADLYNCFDVFVNPSLAESFGMTALEAIACGTPVACFDIGGLRDIVQHKTNGFRAIYKDSKDLANAIVYCIENFKDRNINSHISEDFVINKQKLLLKTITERNN